MSTSFNSLPLLHKYVLSPHDDIELRMTKLKFRLCVKEVSDLQQLRGRGIESTHGCCEFDDDSPSPLTGKTDDSGLENDFGIIDNSRCEANTGDIPVEYDASRQGDSVIDETYDSDNEYEEEEQEQEGTTKEKEEEQEDEEEQEQEQQQQRCIIMNEEEEEEEEEEEAGFEIHIAPKDVCEEPCANDLGSAPRSVSAVESALSTSAAADGAFSCLTSDEHPAVDGEHVEKRKTEAQDPIPSIDSSTATKTSRPENPLQNGEKGFECSDVLEALRILKTKSDWPKVTARKAAVVAFSSWNTADLKRVPQKTPGECLEHSEQTIKRKSELQATNEKILNKERKINEMYKKIKQRDEEDQRMMEELMKKQKIPDAEPLQPPVATVTTTTTTTPTAVPSSGNSDTLQKSFQTEREEENRTPRSTEGTLPRKSTPDTEEGPAAKKKKKKKTRQGSFLQNMAHSVQRRFSRRGRETVT